MDEAQQSPILELGNGVKAIFGAIGSSLIFGAIFWAGATYNRIQAIEVHLISIDSAVAKIGDLQTVQERTIEIQRRLDKLEAQSK